MSSSFPTRSDINWAVKQYKMARGVKFRIKEEEGFHYLQVCNDTKETNQLCGYPQLISSYMSRIAKFLSLTQFC